MLSLAGYCAFWVSLPLKLLQSLIIEVGIFTALIAYMIMISEVVLFSAKQGYCKTSLLTSQSECMDGQFHLWQENPLFRFLLYAIVALAYACTASAMTMATLTIFPGGKRLYMAAGSGIPEIKTILGGFVIHGFL